MTPLPPLPEYLFPSALVAIRIGAALRLLPFPGGGRLPRSAWLGITAALTIAMVPPASGASISDLEWLTALAVKEAFIGTIIGLMCRMTLSVLEMAAQLSHLTSALPAEGQAPESGGFVTAYTLTGAVLFFGLEGHHHLLFGFASTLDCLPVDQFFPIPDRLGAPAVIRLFAAAMAAAVMTAGPIFAARVAADMTIGCLAHILDRAAVTGASVLQNMAVLAAAGCSLGFAVTQTLALLRIGMDRLAMCGGP